MLVLGLEAQEGQAGRALELDGFGLAVGDGGAGVVAVRDFVGQARAAQFAAQVEAHGEPVVLVGQGAGRGGAALLDRVRGVHGEVAPQGVARGDVRVLVFQGAGSVGHAGVVLFFIIRRHGEELVARGQSGGQGYAVHVVGAVIFTEILIGHAHGNHGVAQRAGYIQALVAGLLAHIGGGGAAAGLVFIAVVCGRLELAQREQIDPEGLGVADGAVIRAHVDKVGGFLEAAGHGEVSGQARVHDGDNVIFPHVRAIQPEIAAPLVEQGHLQADQGRRQVLGMGDVFLIVVERSRSFIGTCGFDAEFAGDFRACGYGGQYQESQGRGGCGTGFGPVLFVHFLNSLGRGHSLGPQFASRLAAPMDP